MYRFKNGMLTITTVIDVSSGNETPTRQEIQFTPVKENNSTQTPVQPVLKPRKRLNKADFHKVLRGNPYRPWHTRAQLEFIDHVVMIWLNRARRHIYQSVHMPDYILKGKATQAAMILNRYSKFYAKSWLPAFKMKQRNEDTLQSTSNVSLDYGGNSMLIADIIRDEWLNFFPKDYLSGDAYMKGVEENQLEIVGVGEVEIVEVTKEKTSKTNHQDGLVLNQEEQVNQVIDNTISNDPSEIVELSDSDDEISNDPIQTYDEALDCLELVDQYALCTRNLTAVGLISQIEEFLKGEQHP